MQHLCADLAQPLLRTPDFRRPHARVFLKGERAREGASEIVCVCVRMLDLLPLFHTGSEPAPLACRQCAARARAALQAPRRRRSRLARRSERTFEWAGSERIYTERRRVAPQIRPTPEHASGQRRDRTGRGRGLEGLDPAPEVATASPRRTARSMARRMARSTVRRTARPS